jgi:riboflavin kinase/FMN adenylyltransferase
MTGIIIKGKGLAKQLGFPTLNLHISQKEKLIPADGVYQVRARFENKNHDGVMNIGFAPTIPDKLKANQLRSLEIHLFDYQESGLSHFNEQVMVEFITRIRPERKFDNIEQLKQQIACDIKIVKETLPQIFKNQLIYYKLKCYEFYVNLKQKGDIIMYWILWWGKWGIGYFD